MKVTAALLLAALVAAISAWVSESVYVIEYLDEPAYQVAGTDEPAVDVGALRRSWPQALDARQDRVRLMGYMQNLDEAAAEGEPEEEGPAVALDLETRLAHANVARGEQLSRQCSACHLFDQSNEVRLGPTLWGVAGREVAAVAGFDYSEGMQAYADAWSLETLDEFLANPMGIVPGTRMTYVGVPEQQERADVIAYLNTLTDNPLPMPAPAEGAAPAAPAETGAP
jgi:cytochrome c